MKVLFVGLGALGGKVLDLCFRLSGRHHFLAAGRNVERVRDRANVAALSAVQLGSDPQWATAKLDLWNEEQIAEVIDNYRPDVVVCSVIIWVHSIFDLPASVAHRLYDAQIGPWLPMNLALPLKLMRAVEQCGIPVKVVNVSNPDIVNPVLGSAGLPPVTGIGQLSNSVPALRTVIARQLDKQLGQVGVCFFGGHYVSRQISRHGTAGDAPFSLKAFVDGEDVTHLLTEEAIFAPLCGELRRTPGNIMTAASAAVVIDGIINDTGVITHAPGPNGMPGGYPVRVDATGVELVIPGGMTREDAIRVNERCQPFDGIERIEADGTVHFTEKEMGILTEVFGYECRQMPIADVEARALELRDRFDGFVASLKGTTAVR